MTSSTNPLLQPFTTPFHSIPFQQIKNSHFLPALEVFTQQAKKEIAQIKQNSATPDFHNTIEALERSGEKIGLISHTFFSLHSAESDEELRDVAKKFSPLLTQFGNDILLDAELFQKIKICYEKRNNWDLTPEQKTLLEETYSDFVRNGANLSAEEKEKLRKIDQRLSELSLIFSDHVLKETQKHFLILHSLEDLKGLPEANIEQAKLDAETKNLAGKYVITLDFPSYYPFMKYAEKRDLRKNLHLLYAGRAYHDGENDNKPLVQEIASLRLERANLLGFPSHAHFVLEKRMAQNPHRVKSFLSDLLLAAKDHAHQEMRELQQFASELDGIKVLERWDYAYYAEKLKKKKFAIDDEILRPYFKLENVIDGVFQVARKLYNLIFIPAPQVATYHPDVKVYEVRDEEQNKLIGLFYADFFPRAGKRNGAWMTPLQEQRKEADGSDFRPHVSIVCNFTKSTPTRPSLLTLDEVKTLFHEFGHALHGLLSECQYSRLAGTNVYWDFVELPSQIFENWVDEKETLDLFAVHYQTGEKIPAELVRKLKESSVFHEGYATLRQISLGLIDYYWHSEEFSQIKKDQLSVDDIEKKATAGTSLFPETEGSNISCSFSHIFSGGYSSGYYSYKWAEVLDADAFEYFKENGIFNKTIAQKFRQHILSKGGSQNPAELYRQFRGQDPSIKPLLKRAGLISA